MAITGELYRGAIKAAFNKELDWDTDDIRFMLLGSGYTPDLNLHDYLDDVVAQEIAAGGGYTAGGIAIAGRSISTITDGIAFVATDTVISASTISARYAAIYSRTPATDATRPLIALVDFGQVVSSFNDAFTMDWDTNGIFRIYRKLNVV